MRVDLCGVRGSTPAPGREFEEFGGHTSCVALTHDGADVPTLLLDAGTGIRAATALLDGGPFRGTLLLTHLHWDHMQGLPFFRGGDRPDSEVSVHIPEQEDGSGPLQTLDRAMSPPFFPISGDQLRGSWSFQDYQPGEYEHEGFHVLAREVPHKGGRTYGLRISSGDAVLTYMPDHCPTALGLGPDGWGEYHDAALELARDSDLLLHDAQLLSSELPAEAMTGHACGQYAQELARRAGARAVLLFHHRPERTDAELHELAAQFHGEPAVAMARQGSTLRL